MVKKFRIHTLGCRTNQYEAEGFRTQLEAIGWQAALEEEAADLCLVNSCTVTDAADRQSAYDVRWLAKNNPGAKIVVTGCAAERDPSRFGEGVVVFGNKEKETLLQSLFPEELFPEFAINRFEAHTRAFVKVQDGCNSFCTYCIIPYVRGKSRSRPIADVVREVEDLVAAGYKEIVLTGINIGDWEQEGKRLDALVRAVDKIEGLHRLRISSIDPVEVDEPLQEAILTGRTTCPSLHLVLQSGSNAMLKRMNRKYTRQIFQHKVERLQQACRDFTFTTDVIVGFPGETQEDHLQTLAVIEETQFAKVHMFPYSPRERTRAALYPDRLAAEVMRERKQQVQTAAERSAFLLRQRFVGQQMEVLIEGTIGHTANFLPVMVTGRKIAWSKRILSKTEQRGLSVFAISVDQPYRPFTRRFGQRLLLPPDQWVEIYPDHIRLPDRTIALPGGVKSYDFVAQLDLLKGVVMASFGPFRFTVRADRIRFDRRPKGVAKEIALSSRWQKPEYFERLSCGVYKSQEWEKVCRRGEAAEILPLQGLAAQWSGGAGVDGDNVLACPGPTWEEIRALFVEKKSDGLHIHIPKKTRSGRLVGARWGSLEVDLEWTQGRPRRLILSEEVPLITEAHSFRTRRGKKIYIDRFLF